jgi:hypothetical protein
MGYGAARSAAPALGAREIVNYLAAVLGGSFMLRGFLDVLVSPGYFEGWAYDVDAPTEPVLVSVVEGEGTEVAFGFAHLYRRDLVAAKIGVGWSFFRLRTEASVMILRNSSFRLLERDSGEVLFHADKLKYLEVSDLPSDSVEEIIRHDPTIIRSVDQLAGCEDLFNGFIKLHGVDMFVRTAYVYVLGRPADSDGLALYGKLIRRGMVTPFAMLETLASSTEFRSRPRSLGAPNTAGFPFVWN